MDFVIVVLALLILVSYYLFSTMQDSKLKKAEKAVETGDLDTALSIFMESLRKDPNNIESLWHLGNINEEKLNYPEAIGYYSKLIETGKESKLFTQFELYRRVGILYRKIGRDQEALDNLFQAYNYIQSSKDVLENIAMIIYTQKYFHRAISYFEKAVQFLKNRPDFLKHFALCYIMVGRNQDALGLLGESVKQEPNDFETRYLLSYVYFKMDLTEKARELIEDLVNLEKNKINIPELYFAVKILFLIYLKAKNYDTSRELIQQLKNLNATLNIDSNNEEIAMAYIFFRVKQGYFDIALEEIGKNINFKTSQDVDNLSLEAQNQLKQSRSHIYELVSSLQNYKKEMEKEIYTINAINKFDVEYSMIENKAKDAQRELDAIFEEWKVKFINQEPFWGFFGPKTKEKFDPTLIIDKYAEDNIKSLKKTRSSFETKNVLSEKTNEVSLESQNPCDVLLAADFPTFLSMSQKLVENMGFKIINQGVKIDAMAYSEGQAYNVLCQEKFNRDSKVLFCVRRWSEPVGYISIISILTAFKNLQANRLVIVSTSPLSLEADKAIEGNAKITFYDCNEISSYF